MTEIHRVSSGNVKYCPASRADQSDDPCDVCATCGFCSHSSWSNGSIYVCVTLGNFCTCIPYPEIDERKKMKEDREKKRYYSIIPNEKMTKKRVIEILHFQYTHIKMPPFNERINLSKGNLAELMAQVSIRKIDLQLIQKQIMESATQ